MRNFVEIRPASLAFALALAACGTQAEQTAAATGTASDAGAAAATTSAVTANAPLEADGQADAGAVAPPENRKPGAEDTQRDRAVFEAAGFTFAQGRGQWESGACGDPPQGAYEPGTIERVEDINGDGRPEAIVTEGGTCYGNTGLRFWLLSRQANGQWTVMMDSIAIPELLATRGVDNFPDVQGGGPGFCFPVARWNGREYRIHRHEYEGRPCAPPR